MRTRHLCRLGVLGCSAYRLLAFVPAAVVREETDLVCLMCVCLVLMAG